MISDAVLKSVLQFPENLKNKFLVFYLILSLCLLYIQANIILDAVIQDLETINDSSKIDAYLYTADVNYSNIDTRTCQRCETYKEKKYSEFIKSFMSVIQRINTEEEKE